MNNYFTIPKILHVRNCIHSFWQTERDICLQTEIIIPKGIVEVIFNLSEQSTLHAQIGGKHYQLPKCFISGFYTTVIQLQLPPRQILFGIRFHPVAIKSIFGIPAGEFSDLPVDLTLIDPSINSLWYLLMEQPGFNDRVAIVSNWVKSRNFHLTDHEQLFNYFLNDVEQVIPSVNELSNRLFYSSRQLSRKLQSITGMNTEEVLVYKKYLRSIDLIHQAKFSLTQIAYSCQFADQSHFIKTFKSFASMTPTEYKKLKSPLPGHIYLDVR